MITCFALSSTPPRPQNCSDDFDVRLLKSSFDAERAVHNRGSLEATPRCYDHDCNGRAFSTYGNLRRHQREHGRDSQFRCPSCSRHFKRRSNLRTHMRRKPPSCQGGPLPATTAAVSPQQSSQEITHAAERSSLPRIDGAAVMRARECNVFDLAFGVSYMSRKGDQVPPTWEWGPSIYDSVYWPKDYGGLSHPALGTSLRQEQAPSIGVDYRIDQLYGTDRHVAATLDALASDIYRQ